ncbi:hypothetical protein MP228_010818 [Amoeboaphelidium protococcarum]|nr:hypothetical protein MP228_010818 [Amoeboaphelidium protococcarum]
MESSKNLEVSSGESDVAEEEELKSHFVCPPPVRLEMHDEIDVESEHSSPCSVIRGEIDPDVSQADLTKITEVDSKATLSRQPAPSISITLYHKDSQTLPEQDENSSSFLEEVTVRQKPRIQPLDDEQIESKTTPAKLMAKVDDKNRPVVSLTPQEQRANIQQNHMLKGGVSMPAFEKVSGGNQLRSHQLKVRGDRSNNTSASVNASALTSMFNTSCDEIYAQEYEPYHFHHGNMKSIIDSSVAEVNEQESDPDQDQSVKPPTLIGSAESSNMHIKSHAALGDKSLMKFDAIPEKPPTVNHSQSNKIRTTTAILQRSWRGSYKVISLVALGGIAVIVAAVIIILTKL